MPGAIPAVLAVLVPSARPSRASTQQVPCALGGLSIRMLLTQTCPCVEETPPQGTLISTCPPDELWHIHDWLQPMEFGPSEAPKPALCSPSLMKLMTGEALGFAGPQTGARVPGHTVTGILLPPWVSDPDLWCH